MTKWLISDNGNIIFREFYQFTSMNNQVPSRTLFWFSALRADRDILYWFCTVLHIAEIDFAQFWTLLRLTVRGSEHCWDYLCAVLNIAEIDCARFQTLLRLTVRGSEHCWDRLCAVLNAAKNGCARLWTLLRFTVLSSVLGSEIAEIDCALFWTLLSFTAYSLSWLLLRLRCVVLSRAEIDCALSWTFMRLDVRCPEQSWD